MVAKGQTRFSKTLPAIPLTPDSAAPPRRSLRTSTATATATAFDPPTPVVPTSVANRTNKSVSKRSLLHPEAPIVTPDHKKQRRSGTPLRTPQKRDVSSLSPVTPDSKQQRRSGPSTRTAERRVYYKKVVFDGVVFEVGDDVYLKRREGPESDDDEPEVEECRICFREGGTVMIECDDCLGGFHLKCLKPPLRKVPEGDWICSFCEGWKLGKVVQFPSPPKGKMVRRTAKEKLLSSDLWAVRIESLWKEPDGTYWLKCRWYIIPEETAVGRQPHNLRRELYRTNNCNDVEMECVIRHCYVMNPKAYSEAKDAGDDVFYCEYEYDIHWHNFKRITDVDDANEDDNGVKSDEDWVYKDFDAEEDSENEGLMKLNPSHHRKHEMAANSCKGRTFGLQKIGMKTIPEHTRHHKQTDLEKAKGMLLLASLPKFLPCRTREMEEITAFIKGAIHSEHCLGRCLYIHGVPGTGKTMSVLSVVRNLRYEVDAGTLRPYTFVEINGLKLASPENIYKVIHEALSGHRAGWKKALHFLNERFNNGTRADTNEHRPCVLLIDELDLLLTRNQSVLYNILDWPTKPHANLIIIGIANTMDLPEKLLPRISSRMGIQRLCFGPYTYQQLQEIISSRLNGLDAFEDQAIEFASRKVAAMSGDARRALEICRRAAEIADYQLKQSMLSKQSSVSLDLMEEKQRVGMTHIQAALEEVFQAPHIQIMKTSSRLCKIFLVAMVRELYRTGLGETNFEKLATTVISMCSSNREAPPGWDTLMKVGCKLGESRIILCEEGTKHRLQKLQLNFPSDDVSFALKDCSELPWLAKYL